MDVGILSNMGELKFIINININIYIKITYIGSLVFYYKQMEPEKSRRKKRILILVEL